MVDREVHAFTNETEAKEAIKKIDDKLGYPRQGAQNYTTYFLHNAEHLIFADECTIDILGPPVTRAFEII